jgi:general secretion pathway protein J
MKTLQKTQGFTLVELLVAMAIFSLMTVVAYAGLAAVMQNDQSSLAHETALKRVQRAMVFIEKDLRQLSTRTRNDGYSELQPGLKSDGGGAVLLEFSRAGNSNPTDLSRSSLQRIQYVVEEEKLYRLSWNLIDHSDAEPVKMMLMDGVTGASVSFFSVEGETLESWAKPELPIGVEVKLTTERWGEIRRVLPIYY